MKSMLFLALVLTISTQWVSADDTAAAVPAEDFQRTVILLQKEVGYGDFVFLRGGIGHDQREGCTGDAATSACAIPIRANIVGTNNTEYNAWSTNDTKLDWYGAESNQPGTDAGVAADGTPMVWTTNDVNYTETVSSHGYGYTPLNAFGEHYWMADLDIDCSKTEEGWFELKGKFKSEWESDISQDETCQGNADLGAPGYTSGNHFAKCGYLNAFVFNSNACHIDSLSE